MKGIISIIKYYLVNLIKANSNKELEKKIVIFGAEISGLIKVAGKIIGTAK